jgi:hypothetical protein
MIAFEPLGDEARIAVDGDQAELAGSGVGKAMRDIGRADHDVPLRDDDRLIPSRNVASPASTMNTSGYGCRWTGGPLPGTSWTRITENGMS